MRIDDMRRLLRRVALLACLIGLAALLAAGSFRLDERYLSTRFTLSDQVRLCPLATTGSIVTPMCSAMPGW